MTSDRAQSRMPPTALKLLPMTRRHSAWRLSALRAGDALSPSTMSLRSTLSVSVGVYQRDLNLMWYVCEGSFLRLVALDL